MEKNEQETPRTLFSIWFIKKPDYNILVASICANNDDEYKEK